ncbi:bactericidal permeability-increasing protein-like [Rhinophrynus dorsalis]
MGSEVSSMEGVWQVGVEELQRRLESLQVPDVSGSIYIPVLGSLYYSVSQLKIQNLDLSDSDVSFSSDTGVQALVSNGQILVTGHVRMTCVLFGASSELELSVSGLSLAAVLGLTRDDIGHGAVWNAGCSSRVGQVSIGFHGGSWWLFSMFQGQMVGPIRDALSKQLCPEFDKTVIQLEQVMSDLPVARPVDSVAALEFPLVAPPIIIEESLDLLLKGQFVGLSQRWDFPSPPEKLVLPDLDSHMVLLALSQFSANSAGYVHYKSGILRTNITDDMIPKRSPIRLTINSLGIFVPELPSRFPDSPPVLLQVSALSPPSVICQPDTLTLHVSLDIQVFAMYPEQTLTPIFQIQADVDIQVEVILSEDSLGAVVSLRNLSLSLVHSDTGPVMVDSMQHVMSFALKAIIIPSVNGRLKNIFPIPTPHLRFQDPQVRVLQGYLVILTDVQLSLRTSQQRSLNITTKNADRL